MTRSHFSRARLRALLGLGAAYGLAIVLAAGLFVAYRLHVWHATFAQRSFFWIGDIYTDDPDIGFKMAPNRDGFAVLRYGVQDPARHIPVRTDAHGFRIPMHGDPQQLEPGGLAAVGCSCTFGHGVAAESTFVYRAADMLSMPAHNLGVCSYSAVTSLELLRKTIDVVQPDIVVYGYGNFHLERSQRPRNDPVIFQAYLEDRDGGVVRRPRFDNRVVFALEPRIEETYYRPRLRGETVRFDRRRAGVLLPLVWQDLTRTLHPRTLALRFEDHTLSRRTFARWVAGTLRSVAHDHGARAVLLYFPAHFGERPLPEIVEAVQALGAPDELRFVDTSPGLFAGIADQDAYAARWQVPRDGHPNRWMHEEMARALARALVEAGWVAVPPGRDVGRASAARRPPSAGGGGGTRQRDDARPAP